MSNYKRTTDDVWDEKMEDRGWNAPDGMHKPTHEEVAPLPFSEEEYKALLLALSKKALETSDPETCATYFEVQRRGVWGNHYPLIPELQEVEETLWQMGMNKKTDEESRSGRQR